MTTRFAESPEQGLAEGFAGHVERWALSQAAPASAARAARHAAGALSLAIADGHVCLLLSDLAAPPEVATRPAGPALPGDAATWRQALLASNVVGTPESPGTMPLVLDGDGRLYLHRHFDYERRLAKRLLRAAFAALPPTDALPRLRQRLNELFAGNAARLGDAADWQKLAAALALRGRLTVISGGPGTGKTTTVVNLLACLIELEPDCRIALAAPTGKAAARMTEAIRLRAAHLPEQVRMRLPTESFTVHRLLGVTPGLGGFVHHAGNPLAIDALVVDEASMLDLALATKLLEAVPEAARIVLLGDKDQLAAVESGAVFAELSVDPTLSAACVQDLSALTSTPAGLVKPPAPTLPSALRDAAVWFTQNFRFERDSGIGRLAALVNAGDARQALDWLRGGSNTALRWLDDGGATPSAQTLQRIVDGYAPFIEAVRRDAKDRRAISDAFGRFRVLCAVRHGSRGVGGLNTELAKRFCAALAQPLPGSGGDAGASAWYLGRPVQVLRNDYVLKLFNGDIGITLPDDSGEKMVWFPNADGGFRAIAPVRLPQHETAFAMTVHKAQGSEFDQVLVLLPDQRSRVLTRELLYTGITRTRGSVTVCASAPMLGAAIGTTTRRHSGLLARLRDG
jgi:exodeoxyribonuclease V alpha subunit